MKYPTFILPDDALVVDCAAINKYIESPFDNWIANAPNFITKVGLIRAQQNLNARKVDAV